MNPHAVLICRVGNKIIAMQTEFSLLIFDLLVSLQYNVNTEITTTSLNEEPLSTKKIRAYMLKENKLLLLAALVDSYSLMLAESALLPNFWVKN